MRTLRILILAAFGCCHWQVRGAAAPPEQSPESRAVAFLAREVPRWSAQNKCFSCHNNGDGARALYAASALGHTVPQRALTDTTAWLARPAQWDQAKGDPSYSDRRLARIQFAAALSAAVGNRAVRDREALGQAAAIVARDQQADGSWPVDAEGSVGSPVTYGAVLATHMAANTLRQADRQKHKDAIAKADAWLNQFVPSSVTDAAALLLARRDGANRRDAGHERAWELLRRGQSRDGGWGPYVNSPPEAFDTALVLLALCQDRDHDESAKMLARGRQFLIAVQRPSGDWPETTRPAGNESYAQRISTTAWATLALLETGKLADRDRGKTDKHD